MIWGSSLSHPKKQIIFKAAISLIETYCSMVFVFVVHRMAKHSKFLKKSTPQSPKYNFPKTILVFFSAGITTSSKPLSLQRMCLQQRMHQCRLGSPRRWHGLALCEMFYVKRRLRVEARLTALPTILCWHTRVLANIPKPSWNYKLSSTRNGFKQLQQAFPLQTEVLSQLYTLYMTRQLGYPGVCPSRPLAQERFHCFFRERLDSMLWVNEICFRLLCVLFGWIISSSRVRLWCISLHVIMSLSHSLFVFCFVSRIHLMQAPTHFIVERCTFLAWDTENRLMSTKPV